MNHENIVLKIVELCHARSLECDEVEAGLNDGTGLEIDGGDGEYTRGNIYAYRALICEIIEIIESAMPPELIPMHEHLLMNVYYNQGYVTFRHPEEGPGPQHKPETFEEALSEIEAVDGGQDFHIFLPDPSSPDEGKYTRAATVMLMIGYVDPEENVVDWSVPANACQEIKDFMEQWFKVYGEHVEEVT